MLPNASPGSRPGRIPRSMNSLNCDRFGASALDWAGWTKQDAVVAYVKSLMHDPE